MSELEQTLGFCARCERIVIAPCKPNAALSVDGLSATEELPPPLAMTIRAKPETDLLTQQFACVTGRQLARLDLSPQEVRVFTTYRIYEGLANGVTYETPWGSALEIEPETIEEVFDGRPTAHLEADVPSWEDEPVSYDRSIRDWLMRSMEGRTQEEINPVWRLRLMFIDLALRTPGFDTHDPD